MKVRMEVELVCDTGGCNYKEWSLTTFELNEKAEVRNVPGSATVVEDYTQEHSIPEGWGKVVKGSKLTGYTYEVIVCPKCLEVRGKG